MAAHSWGSLNAYWIRQKSLQVHRERWALMDAQTQPTEVTQRAYDWVTDSEELSRLGRTLAKTWTNATDDNCCGFPRWLMVADQLCERVNGITSYAEDKKIGLPKPITYYESAWMVNWEWIANGFLDEYAKDIQPTAIITGG